MMKRDASANPTPAPLTAASADRVLLVEDESRLREMLTRALREMGFHPTATGSAEAALRVLEHGPPPPPGILILDLNLPGMDGMQLLGTLRQRWPTLQVVILTGFGDLEAAKKAIHLDVVDFLTKPCALGDLEIALDRARSRLRPREGPDPAARAEMLDRAARNEVEEAERAAEAAAEDVPPRPQPQPPPLEFTPRESSSALSLEEVERQHILAALDRNRGNRNATAAELGISLRKLYYRLAQYQKQGHVRESDA